MKRDVGGWNRHSAIARAASGVRIVAAGLAAVGMLGTILASAPAASAAAFGAGDEAVVVDGALNLRAVHDLSAKVLKVLADGTEVTITDGPEAADGADWYEVSLDGDDPNGWVAGKFLADPATADRFANGDGVRVVGGRLNLRAAAGTNAEVLRVLEDGDAAVIAGGPTVKNGFTWYKIHSAGFGAGWVAGEFLVTDDGVSGCEGQGPCPATLAEGDTLSVVTDRLNFRADPALDGAVVIVLEEGDTATFTGETEFADGINWTGIEVAGRGAGWVARQCVVKV